MVLGTIAYESLTLYGGFPPYSYTAFLPTLPSTNLLQLLFLSSLFLCLERELPLLRYIVYSYCSWIVFEFCVLILQVLCVLLSIGGVTLVSFFSNSNNCPSTQNHTQNHTHISNDSYIPDHMVSHLNSKGVTCSPEKSTPLGYVVSLSLSLSLSLFLSLFLCVHVIKLYTKSNNILLNITWACACVMN